MKALLNVIWLLFGGIWLALEYAIAGIIACITIIGIPFGIAAFRIAGYALWPFGRTVVPKPTAGIGSTLGNIVWVLLCGWWIALSHLISGVLMCVTIIGIPLGVANFKLIPVSLVPLGKDIVPT